MSSFIIEPNDPSSNVDPEGNFDVDYGEKPAKKSFNKNKTSNSPSVVKENDNNRYKTHETSVSDAENCLLSNTNNLKSIFDYEQEDVEEQEKLRNSFSKNLRLNENNFQFGENVNSENKHNCDTQSAILEYYRNSSIANHEAKPSTNFNLLEKEDNPANDIDVNNVEFEEKEELLGACSENLPISESIDHYEESDNADLFERQMQSAILESLQESSASFEEDELRSPLKHNLEQNQINNLGLTPEIGAGSSGKETLSAEKLRLETEIKYISASVKNKKSVLDSTNKNVPPGKAKKLNDSIAKEERSLQTLFKKLNHVKNKIDPSSVNNLKKTERTDKKSLNFSSLPSADLQNLGKKELETHRVEQSLTVESLKTLHKSLKSCPPDNKIVADPFGLMVPLMNHQKQALAWLVWREKQKPSGGILADDMGLGKTLSMISLILKRKEKSENAEENDFINDKKVKHNGGTLIICPASLIGQWESEIRFRVRPHLLNHEIYHGQKREKDAKQLIRHDIVITTYAIARVEFENFSDGGSGSIFQINWKRIILDEAHTIRNHQSKTAKAVFKLQGVHRWALTGTPVHNKTQDFFALIKFLHCCPFDDIAIWKKWVEAKDETGLQRLNMLTKSLMLRRTKDLLMSEGKLPSLPEKSYETVSVKLSKEEWTLYEEVANFSKTLLSQLLFQRAEKEQLLNGGIIVSNAKNIKFQDGNPFSKHPALQKLYKRLGSMQDIKTHEILVLLLRLRQICCHPVLIKSMVEKEAFLQDGMVEDEVSDLDISQQITSTTLKSNENDKESSQSDTFNLNNRIFDPEWPSSKIKAILELLRETISKTDDKIVIVSQWTSMLELIGNFLKKLKNCKFESLTGKVPVNQRMDIVFEFNRSSSSIRVLLLSLTAGGTGLNLVGANQLILTDLHWNPQQEAQACDRIYRMGQTKPVKVYKIFCTETIEERIQQLQLTKLALADGILSGEKHVQVGKLSLNDLKMLFNVE